MFNEVSEVTMKFFADVFWNVTVRRRFQVIYCLHTVIFYITRSFNKKLQQLHSQTVIGSDEIKSELGHVARTGYLGNAYEILVCKFETNTPF